MIRRSFSIEESTNNGVLICEFVLDKQKVKFNDSTYFEFDHIWMGYPWWYVNQNKDVEVLDSSNTVVLYTFVNTTDDVLFNLGIDICAIDKKYSGYNNIYFDIDGIEEGRDSIILRVNYYDKLESRTPSLRYDSTFVTLKRKSIL